MPTWAACPRACCSALAALPCCLQALHWWSICPAMLFACAAPGPRVCMRCHLFRGSSPWLPNSLHCCLSVFPNAGPVCTGPSAQGIRRGPRPLCAAAIRGAAERRGAAGLPPSRRHAVCVCRSRGAAAQRGAAGGPQPSGSRALVVPVGGCTASWLSEHGLACRPANQLMNCVLCPS